MNTTPVKRTNKTTSALFFLFAFLSIQSYAYGQAKTIEVNSFDKVVVSPHSEVVCKEGEKESVVIERIDVPFEKLNVKVNKKTLKIFLDGAGITSKSKKEYINGERRRVPVYDGTVVKAIVTYKKLRSLDLRGEETFVFESPIAACDLRMKIYGETTVLMKELTLDEMKATCYGESYLEIKGGKIDKQKFTAYGESEVNAINVDNNITRLTAYGESNFRIHVSENLRVTSYGESTVE